MSESLFSPEQIGSLSRAYSDVIREARGVHEGTWPIPGPFGKRVQVLIPEAEWANLAKAICSITGGDVA